MRLAILISLAVLGLGGTAALADDNALVPCQVGPRGGYLVPVSYAETHRADIVATLPDGATVDSFWQVSEQISIVADRNLREKMENAVKDPFQLSQLFPDLATGGDTSSPDSLEYQREELKLIVDHYGAYQRQYVGLMIDGHEIVLLNYSMGPGLDPAAGFIFINSVFERGKMHFLQARFNWDYKTLSNVSMYGPWQGNSK